MRHDVENPPTRSMRRGSHDDQYRALIQSRFDKVELDKRPSEDEFARFAALLHWFPRVRSAC